MADYYELLGVSRTASSDEIKKAYRAKARKLHPDFGGDAAWFRLLREAADTLSDPLRRAEYDRSTGRPASSRNSSSAPRVPDLPATQVDWWDRVDPTAEIHWTPPFGRGRRPVLIAGGAWLAGWIIGIVVVAIRGFPAEEIASILTVAVLPPLLLALTLLLRQHRKTRWVLVGLAYYLGLATTGVAIIALVRGELVGLTYLPIAAGFLAAALAMRYRRFRDDDNVFSPEFREFNLFGAPAPAMIYAGHEYRSFDEQRPVAVRLTDQLIRRYLTRIPAVRVFHQLALPGSGLPTIDHAVLSGKRLLLVDSVVWPAGRYRADVYDYVLRDDEPFPDGAISLGAAVRTVRKLLPGVDVRGVVLVWPWLPGTPVHGAWTDTPVSVLDPEDFVGRAGEWLSAQPTTVDRVALLKVRELAHG